jgi:6-phosphogluconolactonase
MIEIQSFSNTTQLTSMAASDVAVILVAAIKERGRATLVLTGGTLGIQILGDLADQNLDLEKIEIFVGDERYVALDHPDRNEFQSIEAWPELAGAHFNRFPATGRPLDAAAEAANAEFVNKFGPIDTASAVFDVVLLGMGPDGHVASLFPGKQHEMAWVIAEHASPKPPAQRLSLSYQALNRARNVFFLASGEGKLEAAKSAIQDVNSQLPAAKVTGLDLTRWYLDEEISRGL